MLRRPQMPSGGQPGLHNSQALGFIQHFGGTILAAPQLATRGFGAQVFAMRAIAVQLSVLAVAVVSAAMLGACSGEHICTEEERIAVRVHVSSPFGLPSDRVTAEQDHEMVCAFSSSSDDATTDFMYRCAEQGEGIYIIRAYSGDQVWSARVHVNANECHTTEIKDVDLVLDPAHPSDPDRDEHVQEGQSGQGR
jgi:hypothetical protein